MGSASGSAVRFWVQKTDDSPPQAVTPEGKGNGLLLTLNHMDYIGAHEANGFVLLYPLDGGEPKPVAGFAKTGSLVGGSSELRGKL